jgi:hypothetical protein
MKKNGRASRLPANRKYRVQAEISNLQLAKAKSALRLRIFARGEKVGEVEVGRGSLYWYGVHRQRSKRIGWGLFAEMMDKLAYR